VEEVVPKLVPLSTLQRILQVLLEEDVSIRDMRTILDALAEHAAAHPGDVQELTALVRVALGRAITQQWFGSRNELHVIGLDLQLEQVLLQAVNNGALEPGLADNLMQQMETALARQEANGEPPVLVVPHRLRALLSRFLRRRLRHLVVMSLVELPDDRSLRVTSLIGGK
ncbi:FHIPEP family type III secretion protein, partial [Azotobacter chroococcum]|nr:FHIPEP family type III secretion protein [Azotobacter chroococcum]